MTSLQIFLKYVLDYANLKQILFLFCNNRRPLSFSKISFRIPTMSSARLYMKQDCLSLTYIFSIATSVPIHKSPIERASKTFPLVPEPTEIGKPEYRVS